MDKGPRRKRLNEIQECLLDRKRMREKKNGVYYMYIILGKCERDDRHEAWHVRKTQEGV